MLFCTLLLWRLYKIMAKKQSLEKKMELKNRSAQRKAERAHEESAILYRCLTMLGVLAIAEIYFLLCYKFMVNGTMEQVASMAKTVGIMSWVGLAGAAVGVVLTAVRGLQKFKRLGGWILLLGVVIAVGSQIVLRVFPTGVTFMCVAVPVLAMVGFVFYLYQKEFLFSGLGVGLSIVGAWLAHRAINSSLWSGRVLFVEIVLLVLDLILLAVSVKIAKNDGKWGKGGKGVQVFTNTTSTGLLNGALGFAAAALLIVAFAPSTALYLMWAGIGILFILAVYYTVHMM